MRALGMRHFDVQLIGGAVLHSGKIAEMKTGEGKTLVATLPCVLNALAGRGVTSSPSTTTWPGATRSGWGGSTGSAACRRRDRPRPHRQGAPGCLPLRHHLRAEQRVRLRLPARQHEVPAAGLRPGRAELRHRRRGRLDPGGRGPDPAHHLRPVRRVLRAVLHGQPGHPLDDPGRRLHRGREEPDHRHDRRRAWRRWRRSSPSRTSTRPRRSRPSTTSSRRSAPTTSTGTRWTTWSRTARCSSSTSSPAGSCRGAAGRTGSTRRWRPRKGSRSRPRTRPWPPSPSRTTSACTRSWRA